MKHTVRFFEKNGDWWLDIRAAGKRKRVSTLTSDRATADRLAGALVTEALAAFALPDSPSPATVPQARQTPRGPTLREAFKLALTTREKWIESKDKDSLETTYSQLGLADDFPVAELTRDKVRQLRSQWLEQPGKKKGSKLSASTINHRLSMLSVLLEICDLPPHTVKHLSTRGTRRTRRMPDKEIQAVRSWLFASAKRKGALAMADMITVALETAGRLSELLGLLPSDIQEDTVTFRDTKNGESRTVPLPPASKRLLELRKGLPGGPFAELTLSQAEALWREARAALGFKDDDEFVFHTLRHEAISRLADAGANAFVIQAIAGHSDIATTQIYAKASAQAMREAQGLVQQRAAMQQAANEQLLPNGDGCRNGTTHLQSGA